MNSNSKTYKIVAIAAFLIPLLLMFVLLQIPDSKTTSASENRTLAEKPSMNVKQLDSYPKQYDSYISDHIPFRDVFLDATFVIKGTLGISPTPNVVIGKDNFLFCGINEKILYEVGEPYFPMDKIIAVADKFAERYDSLDKLNIKLYIAIAPTTFEIYPEYLPDYVQRAEKTGTDLFCEVMSEKYPHIPLILLKQNVLKHKKNHNLYLRNDNHWNPYGACFATENVLAEMSKDFPSLPDKIFDKFTFSPFVSKSGNLSDMLRKNNGEYSDTNYLVSYKDSAKIALHNDPSKNYKPIEGFPYPDIYCLRYVTNNTGSPKIVVIRDSYSNAVIPFMSPWFSESVFIFDSWQYGDNYEIINSEKPDIVLYFIYEPYIKNVVP